MKDLISVNWALDTLDVLGGSHLAHLLFKGKCIRIGNTMYLTKAQYQECEAKDRT